MKSFKSHRIIVIALMLLLFVFVNCNQEKSIAGPSKQDLAGTWEITLLGSEYQGEVQSSSHAELDSVGLIWILDFKNDGTVEQTINMSSPVVTMPGKWKESGDKLTLTLMAPNGETGSMVYQYIVEGNILKLDWSMPNGTKLFAEFSRQPDSM